LIQEVSDVCTFLFLDTDESKNGFTGPKSFQGFRETGPRTATTARNFFFSEKEILESKNLEILENLELKNLRRSFENFQKITTAILREILFGIPKLFPNSQWRCSQ